MVVYNRVYALAQALISTPEYRLYNQLVRKACRDEETRKLYREYLSVCERYQHSQMGREKEFSEDEYAHMEQLMDQVEGVPELAEAISARAAYEDILNRSINSLYEITTDNLFEA